MSFAKRHDNSALCLADYGQLKAGAIVPATNALWADVERYVTENGGFDPLPADQTHDALVAAAQSAENETTAPETAV